MQERSSKPEEVIWSLFGMSYDEFISELLENPNGKYDELFAMSASRESLPKESEK